MSGRLDTLLAGVAEPCIGMCHQGMVGFPSPTKSNSNHQPCQHTFPPGVGFRKSSRRGGLNPNGCALEPAGKQELEDCRPTAVFQCARSQPRRAQESGANGSTRGISSSATTITKGCIERRRKRKMGCIATLSARGYKYICPANIMQAKRFVPSRIRNLPLPCASPR